MTEPSPWTGAEPDAHGTRFRVWAPAARAVAVLGEGAGGPFDADLHPVAAGHWEASVAGVGHGDRYRFRITGADGAVVDRADPRAAAVAPGDPSWSRVWVSHHEWGDGGWRSARPAPVGTERLSVYEVHAGSWRRHADGRSLGWRDLAPALADHVADLGFTHVELLPVMAHPFGGSWGYQVTGFFAPDARLGDPDDLRWFVDHLHQRGIGVILDWVPAHFPSDPWALARFDGTACYEHADTRRAWHPDWGTLVFDHGKPEVRRFLVDSACWWLGSFHADGLRVDAVASMLYLDFGRRPGEWEPNERGGNEDLEAVDFLRRLTTEVAERHPGALVVAEESSAWPGVTAPVVDGGLGFTHKWNLGWMHDTLEYFSAPAVPRRTLADKLTFGLVYAWAERFVLPLSHDEVVHLKRSLLGKQPGPTDAVRLAQLRALLAWMWAHPGAQLLFMGGEVGQPTEWDHDAEVPWALLDDPGHRSVLDLVAALNRAQADHPSLWVGDRDPTGFRWLSLDRVDEGVFAFARLDPSGTAPPVVVVANLSDLPRAPVPLHLPEPGPWHVVLASDGPMGPGTTWPWEADLEPATVVWLAPR